MPPLSQPFLFIKFLIGEGGLEIMPAVLIIQINIQRDINIPITLIFTYLAFFIILINKFFQFIKKIDKKNI